MYKRKIVTQFRSCISITAETEKILAVSKVREGLCIVSAPYITMGLTITSFWDPRGLDDLLDETDRNFPTRVSYKNQQSPYHSSGQVKSAVIGNRLTIPIIDGKLLLGSSQGIILMDFDGPRHRHYEVNIIDRKVISSKLSIQTSYLGVHSLNGMVQEIVEAHRITDALCHVSCLHSTAGLARSGSDEAVKQDHMAQIETMVPTRVDFKHRETASDAAGHVKTSLFKSQLDILVNSGRLVLADSEDICFMEYDGPRPRNVVVTLLAGERVK